MPPKGADKRRRVSRRFDLNQQGAHALLAAIFNFLQQNKIAAKSVLEFARQYHSRRQRGPQLSLYKELVRTYDDLGVIMAKWFSDPKFLDTSGHPLSLSQGKGSKSIANLIRVSGAKVKPSVAIEFMRQSPSIRINHDGSLYALRRVFVLPQFEVPRAAFVIERYLDTLLENVRNRNGQAALHLERSAYVSKVNLMKIAPILRDIDGRATAFMDSVDGEIEGLRLRSSQAKCAGELGVLVFAWTKPDKSSTPRTHSRSAQKQIPRRISLPNAAPKRKTPAEP